MKTQEERRQLLAAIGKSHWIETADLESYDNSSGEDLGEYLHDGKEIGRYVAVTSGSDPPIDYLYPCETEAGAEARLTENITDDLFAESPRSIIDLDEGTERVVIGVTVTLSEPTDLLLREE